MASLRHILWRWFNHALAPVGALIWECTPSPRNWYSHVYMTFLPVNEGLCFTDWFSLPVYIVDTEIALHTVVPHSSLVKGSHKGCNISKRPEHSRCSIITSTVVSARSKLKPARLRCHLGGHYLGSEDSPGWPQTARAGCRVSIHHQPWARTDVGWAGLTPQLREGGGDISGGLF